MLYTSQNQTRPDQTANCVGVSSCLDRKIKGRMTRKNAKHAMNEEAQHDIDNQEGKGYDKTEMQCHCTMIYDTRH